MKEGLEGGSIWGVIDVKIKAKVKVTAAAGSPTPTPGVLLEFRGVLMAPKMKD